MVSSNEAISHRALIQRTVSSFTSSQTGAMTILADVGTLMGQHRVLSRSQKKLVLPNNASHISSTSRRLRVSVKVEFACVLVSGLY